MTSRRDYFETPDVVAARNKFIVGLDGASVRALDAGAETWGAWSPSSARWAVYEGDPIEFPSGLAAQRFIDVMRLGHDFVPKLLD